MAHLQDGARVESVVDRIMAAVETSTQRLIKLRVLGLQHQEARMKQTQRAAVPELRAAVHWRCNNEILVIITYELSNTSALAV